jgi:hypothetical protein
LSEDSSPLEISDGGGDDMLDFAKLVVEAHRWSRQNLDCSVVLERVNGAVGHFQMVDDDGEVTNEVTVKDAGTFENVHLMSVDDGLGPIYCEAIGSMLARILYC